MDTFKNYSLEELRAMDYAILKSPQLPDNVREAINNTIKKNQSGMGGTSLGGLMGSNMGSGGLMGNSGGGLMGNTGGMGSGGGLLGGLANNTQRTGLLGGISGGGGLLGGGMGGGGLMGGQNTGTFGGLLGNQQQQQGGGLLGNQNRGGGLLGGLGTGGGGLTGGLLGGGNTGGGLLGLGGGNNTGSLLGGGGGGLLGGGGGGLLGNNQNKQGGLFAGLTGGGGGGGLLGGGQGGGLGLLGGLSQQGGSGGGLYGQQGLGLGQQGGSLLGNLGQGGGLLGGQRTGGGGLLGNLLGGQQGGLLGGQQGGQQMLNQQQLAMMQQQPGMINQQYFNQMNGGLYDQLLSSYTTSVTGHIQGVAPNSEIKVNESKNNAPEPPKKRFEEINQGTLASMLKGGKYPYNPFGRPSGQITRSISNMQVIPKSSKSRGNVSMFRKEGGVNLTGSRVSAADDNKSDDEPDRSMTLDYSKLHLSKSEKLNQSQALQDIEQKRKLQVVFEQLDEDPRAFLLDINEHDLCRTIKTLVLQRVFNSAMEQPSPAKFKLISNNTLLADGLRIKDVGLRDNDKVYLIEDASYGGETPGYAGEKRQKEGAFASEDLIPILKKEGYHSEPSLIRMARMTEEELKDIEEFSVYNDEVRIVWEGKTDVRGLNLDVLVELGRKSVEVYPEGVKIPPEGQGLNKPARIIFYNWSVPRKHQANPDRHKREILEWVNSLGAEFEYYDEDRGEVSIRVRSFAPV
jgi:hypothetical protein